MSIASAVLSLVTGGATGLLGAAVQRTFDFLNKKQDIQLEQLRHTNTLELRKVDMEQSKIEWSNKITVTNIEADAAKDVADSKAFQETVWKEPEMYSKGQKKTTTAAILLAILDFLRGLIRPALTVYLCALTTLIYIEAKTMASFYAYAMDVNTAIDIYTLCINTILYLTTTVVLWWFGVRNKGKPPGAK